LGRLIEEFSRTPRSEKILSRRFFPIGATAVFAEDANHRGGGATASLGFTSRPGRGEVLVAGDAA